MIMGDKTRLAAMGNALPNLKQPLTSLKRSLQTAVNKTFNNKPQASMQKAFKSTFKQPLTKTAVNRL